MILYRLVIFFRHKRWHYISAQDDALRQANHVIDIMMLARFIVPFDLHAVLTYVGVGCKTMSVVFIPPCIVGLLAHEFLYAFIGGGMALGVFVSGSLLTILPSSDLEVKEALAVTALVYLLFGLAGSAMFLPVAPFIDAFFESMSGFTTTGLSVLDIKHLPKTLLFFRAYAQWIGGVGIIILSLAVFLEPGKTAFQLYTSEYNAENLLGSVIATAQVVARVYFGLTILGFLVFLAVGMKPFEALLHILATLSTGGFSPYAESIGHFSSPLTRYAVILFMLVGATSFPLYYLAYYEGPGRLWRDQQVRALITLIVLLGLLFWGLQQWRLDAWGSSLFEAVSALTTTGFAVNDASSWATASKLGMVLLMSIGGATGSTAGGIKLLRFLLLWQLVNWLVIRALLPAEAQVPIKYGEQTVSQHELLQHGGFFVLYLSVLFLSTLLLALAGFSAIDALFESASSLGTVGLSVGVTSSDLSAWAKLLLIFNMWAGRLEFLPVLVCLHPWAWRPRRKAK